MGKITNGAFTIPSGFTVANSAPIDDRILVQDFNDLLDNSELPDVYLGIIVYVANSGVHYFWNGLDRESADNWVELSNKDVISVEQNLNVSFTLSLEYKSYLLGLSGDCEIVLITPSGDFVGQRYTQTLLVSGATNITFSNGIITEDSDPYDCTKLNKIVVDYWVVSPQNYYILVTITQVTPNSSTTPPNQMTITNII